MDLRKRKISLDPSEPSTSSTVSKIVKKTIPNEALSKEQIEKVYHTIITIDIVTYNFYVKKFF